MNYKKAMIMFPLSAASSHLGKQLLTNDYNVYLYVPNDVHVRQAGTLPVDLKIAALSLSVNVELVTTLDNLESILYIPSFLVCM